MTVYEAEKAVRMAWKKVKEAEKSGKKTHKARKAWEEALALALVREAGAAATATEIENLTDDQLTATIDAFWKPIISQK